jgi:GNAT superfamily N-acetyltransferase
MIMGADYRAEHVLVDGMRVVVRSIRPDDADELRRAFARLSPASRYRRFFGGVGELSADTLRYLTDVDGVNHVAFVVVTISPDLKSERGLGVGRFIRSTRDPSVAEAAVTVVDDEQRRGIGRLLLMTLADAARERGVERFRADVLASNAPMLHMLEGAGAVRVRESDEASDGATLTFDVPLGDTKPALARLLREAASSMAVLVRSLAPEAPEAPEK